MSLTDYFIYLSFHIIIYFQDTAFIAFIRFIVFPGAMAGCRRGSTNVRLTPRPPHIIQDTAHYSRLKGDQPLRSFSDSPRNLSSPSSNVTRHSSSATPGDHGELPAGSFEHISQDINTFGINNPVGYLGKCSCLWWIQRAREEIGRSMPLVVGIDTMVDPRVPAVEKLGTSPTEIFVYPQLQYHKTALRVNR